MHIRFEQNIILCNNKPKLKKRISMKKTITFSLTICELICACNSFSMENSTDKNANMQVEEKRQVTQQDIMTLLTENNKLLHTTKQQNKAILKLNYLNFEYQKLLLDCCTQQGISSELANKKET